MTDHKGMLGGSTFGVLLVDTPEMGGRSALDRLANLCERHNLRATLQLQVHDPEGFDPDDEIPSEGRRQHDHEPSPRWQRVDGSGAVATSAEDPMVPRPYLRMAVKRMIDIVGSSVGLVLASPVILLGSAAIKFSDPGPAFFAQTREGYRGRPFTIYKLRTMVMDAEQSQAALRDQNHRDGPAFKMAKDPRVTRVGDFLRKTCIDELPQLWNVLKGDMSLVGPRPLPWHESRACNNWQRRRLDVRPGMTCYWQVDKSKAETFDDWMRLDLRYIDEIGVLQDLKLIVQTFTVPITGRGGD
jgi:lipopolysaccharide/colanic/teichoic acid biosynthesis glycosyltransferase